MPNPAALATLGVATREQWNGCEHRIGDWAPAPASLSIASFRSRGMAILGKDDLTGEVPAWSYAVFVGFHLPTWL